MATTTPNYGWTVPTSTDLVKDGATAIETLGDAIDASMNTALGTKKAMGVLLSTMSFSGVSSQSIPNNTFTATYPNYRIIINIVGSAGVPDIRMRLRASGTDESGNIYRMGRYYIGVTSALTAGSENATTATSFFIGQTSTDYGYIITELSNPQLARRTNGLSFNAASSLSLVGLGVANTTVYDAVTIFPDSGTITGTISTYGVNV
jgi:hypothetical protein